MVKVQGKGSSSNFAPAGSQNAFTEEWQPSQTQCPPKEPQLLNCPECGSNYVDKNGHRYIKNGEDIQRFKCRKCKYRFSEKPLQRNQEWSINIQSDLTDSRQLCAILQEAKKLDLATETKSVAGEKDPKLTAEGQILQYLIYLKNQGYRDSTIEQKDWLLRKLLKSGANLNDPETVKHSIANVETSESYKALLAIAYEGFAKRNGHSLD